jgi:RNA polymerase sigma-70 factor (ECF subfamily)
MTEPTRKCLIEVLEPHLGALYRAAYRLCRNRPDAEDLVQEVCVRAFANGNRFAALDSPRAWLLRVQYNLFVDGTRRAARASADSLEDVEAIRELAQADEIEHVEAAQLSERLSAAWECLSRDQQALLALHTEGYTIAEIALIMGRPRTALKARLHRARVRLGKALSAQPSAPQLATASGDEK